MRTSASDFSDFSDFKDLGKFVFTMFLLCFCTFLSSSFSENCCFPRVWCKFWKPVCQVNGKRAICFAKLCSTFAVSCSIVARVLLCCCSAVALLLLCCCSALLCFALSCSALLNFALPCCALLSSVVGSGRVGRVGTSATLVSE